MRDDLTAAEEVVMRETFKAAMLRAAAIIDGITQEDVTDAQMALYKTGTPLANLHLVDRALIAACHIRSCVEMECGHDERLRAEAILKDLKGRVKP
jgi:hypothetical protein